MMSLTTATSKYLHGKGKDIIESEAVAEVASHEDGGGREDHLEGGRGEEGIMENSFSEKPSYKSAKFKGPNKLF
jgi:hypothetical protein